MNALKELDVYGGSEPWCPFNIATVHPLGDEQELLKKLGMNPSDCFACDLRWARYDELHFVEITSNRENLGVWGRKRFDRKPYLNFHVSISAQLLTTECVTHILTVLDEWISSHPEKKLATESEQIFAHDILKESLK